MTPLAVTAVAHVPQISVPPQEPSLVSKAGVAVGVGICCAGLNVLSELLEKKFPMLCTIVCECWPRSSGEAKNVANANMIIPLSITLISTIGWRRRERSVGGETRGRFSVAGIRVGNLADVVELRAVSFLVVKGEAVARWPVVRGVESEFGDSACGNIGRGDVSAVVICC